MLWYGEMNDFKLLRGFGNRRTDERTDIGGCRVAFTTENHFISMLTLVLVF